MHSTPVYSSNTITDQFCAVQSIIVCFARNLRLLVLIICVYVLTDTSICSFLNLCFAQYDTAVQSELSTVYVVNRIIFITFSLIQSVEKSVMVKNRC